jgi:hypothetical protein
VVAGVLGLALVGGVAATGQAASPAATPTSAAQETVHTTANHPWLTADHGWVPAGLLQPGERLVTLGGGTGAVARVRPVAGPADMYNLTVAQDHTYAVGAGQWVVHNTGPDCGGTHQTPWQVHIDEDGNPIGIDTTQFTSGDATEAGGIRNRTQYWRRYAEKYPDHISPTNAEYIADNSAPVVDEQWVQHFPEHSPYMDQVLVHHHLDYGPFAVPVPKEVHSTQPGWGFWHVSRRGPN